MEIKTAPSLAPAQKLPERGPNTGRAGRQVSLPYPTGRPAGPALGRLARRRVAGERTERPRQPRQAQPWGPAARRWIPGSPAPPAPPRPQHRQAGEREGSEPTRRPGPRDGDPGDRAARGSCAQGSPARPGRPDPPSARPARPRRVLTSRGQPPPWRADMPPGRTHRAATQRGGPCADPRRRGPLFRGAGRGQGGGTGGQRGRRRAWRGNRSARPLKGTGESRAPGSAGRANGIYHWDSARCGWARGEGRGGGGTPRDYAMGRPSVSRATSLQDCPALPGVSRDSPKPCVGSELSKTSPGVLKNFSL